MDWLATSMHYTVKYLLRTNTVLIYTIRNLTRSYGVSNLFHLTPSKSYTNTNHPPTTTTTTFRWPALSYLIRNIQYNFICSQQPIVEMFQSLRTVTVMLKWPCWCLALFRLLPTSAQLRREMWDFTKNTNLILMWSQAFRLNCYRQIELIHRGSHTVNTKHLYTLCNR